MRMVFKKAAKLTRLLDDKLTRTLDWGHHFLGFKQLIQNMLKNFPDWAKELFWTIIKWKHFNVPYCKMQICFFLPKKTTIENICLFEFKFKLQMLREKCILCPPFKTLYYQSSWLKPTLAKAKANLAPSYTPCKRQHKIFILTGT